MELSLISRASNPTGMTVAEVVGVNNCLDMSEYDHMRLVLAAYVCGLTGFKEINTALGGVNEITMKKMKEE